jgi:altronate hydrolase
MSEIQKFTIIDPADNVAVALNNLKAGEEIIIDRNIIILQNDIARGHKFTIKPIAKDADVIKYGYPIGKAQADINPGQHVHIHNLKTKLEGLQEYEYHPQLINNQLADKSLTFKGYRRKNGEVGIRNELWIVPTVGCVNGIGEKMLNALKSEIGSSKLDAMEIFKHNYGCSQLGDDHENTRLILRDIAMHPNAGGILVLGLGCENNQVSLFKELLGEYDTERVKFLEVQKVGNEQEEGLKLLRELYQLAIQDKRTEIPLSELKIGLKCGGSDGLSGITANPLLGVLSDFIIAQGGTAVLTEVPEMFGSETILMNRAKNKETFQKIVALINNFKEYFTQNNQPVYENPSPGNKEGGISTLEEKSLGCTQKCGKATVIDVLNYGKRIKQKGLNLLSAPGNDLVSSTALGASGCQMVLFTTGRGTPFGSFVPTVKIASNTPLYQNKPHWIDFNAGQLAENKTMEELLPEFLQFIMQVASGHLVNNEKEGYREIAIFKSGVTL